MTEGPSQHVRAAAPWLLTCGANPPRGQGLNIAFQGYLYFKRGLSEIILEGTSGPLSEETLGDIGGSGGWPSSPHQTLDPLSLEEG